MCKNIEFASAGASLRIKEKKWMLSEEVSRFVDILIRQTKSFEKMLDKIDGILSAYHGAIARKSIRRDLGYSIT